MSELRNAINHDSLSVIKELLEQGEDPNKHDYLGSSPVFTAVLNNRPGVLRLLFEYGGVIAGCTGSKIYDVMYHAEANESFWKRLEPSDRYGRLDDALEIIQILKEQQAKESINKKQGE